LLLLYQSVIGKYCQLAGSYESWHGLHRSPYLPSRLRQDGAKHFFYSKEQNYYLQSKNKPPFSKKSLRQ